MLDRVVLGRRQKFYTPATLLFATRKGCPVEALGEAEVIDPPILVAGKSSCQIKIIVGSHSRLRRTA